MKYRGRWPRLVHLSADYARDSGTTTMCLCKGHDIPCNRAVHPAIRNVGLDSVQTTGEKAARLHDATSAFDHEDNLDGQSDKQGNTRTDWAAIYGRSSDQKESPVDWTPHEDVTSYQSKFSTLNCLLVTRPSLRFKDTIKRNLKLRDIKTDSWTSLSQPRQHANVNLTLI